MTKEHESYEHATMATGWGGKIHEYHTMFEIESPLEVSHPTLLLKQGHLRAPCSELCPVGFYTSPRMQTALALWATCAQ